MSTAAEKRAWAVQADAYELREATGQAPIPWWWSEDKKKSLARPSTAGTAVSDHHGAFADAALGSLSTDPTRRPVYVHWLYAQYLGFQGFSVPIGDFGKLAMTTPSPLKSHNAALIAAKGLGAAEQQLEFAGWRQALPLLDKKRRERQEEVVDHSSEAPKKGNRRVGAAKSLSDDGKSRPGRGANGPGKSKRVSWKPAGQAGPKREMRASPSGGKHRRSLAMLDELHAEGQLSKEEYREAKRKVLDAMERDSPTPTAAEPPPPSSGQEPPTAPEPTVASTEPAGGPPADDGEAAQDEQMMNDLDAALASANVSAAGGGGEGEAAATEVDAAAPPAGDSDQYMTEEEEERWLARGGGSVVAAGPVLDLQPHGCAFEASSTVELSVDTRTMVGDFRGAALFCALRRTGPHDGGAEDNAGSWEPLEPDEGISLSPGGMLTVQLRTLSRIMVVWLKDQAEPTLAATVEMLAAGILSGFARRGSEPDAAFKAAFRLGCVAAVNITGEHRLAVVAQPGVDADVERRVKVAVFADAERKEAEAAAAAEAARIEAEEAAAAAAEVAALPGKLRQAAKDGHVENYEFVAEDGSKSMLMGLKSILEQGVPVDAVDDKGYTAMYCATMYEKEEAVSFLLGAGAEVDKENNNGVSPLMAAARDGFTAIVKVLLAAGADFEQVDEFGRTADSVAQEKGFDETSAAVLEWAKEHPK